MLYATTLSISEGYVAVNCRKIDELLIGRYVTGDVHGLVDV
jgi:hypothetical protein